MGLRRRPRRLLPGRHGGRPRRRATAAAPCRWRRKTRPRSCAVCACSGGTSTPTSTTRCTWSEVDEWARHYAEAHRGGARTRSPISRRRSLRRPPTKLVAITDADDVDAHPARTCRRRWRDRLFVARSQPEYIEFAAGGVSKSGALQWLCDRLGLRRERAVACGDGRQRRRHAALGRTGRGDGRGCRRRCAPPPIWSSRARSCRTSSCVWRPRPPWRRRRHVAGRRAAGRDLTGRRRRLEGGRRLRGALAPGGMGAVLFPLTGRAFIDSTMNTL